MAATVGYRRAMAKLSKLGLRRKEALHHLTNNTSILTADLRKEARGFFGIVQGLAADAAAKKYSAVAQDTVGAVAGVFVVCSLLCV